MEITRLIALMGSDTDGGLFTVDCLRDAGGLWVVPTWYASPDGKWRTPAIAIRVPPEDAQETPLNPHQLLLQPIAKAVLLGQIEYSEGVRFETLRDEMALAHFGWLEIPKAH